MLGRRNFLKAAGILASTRAFAQTRRPNLLVLTAAQWRAPALDPDLRTPSLERLAGQGLQFERCYVSCPAAAPSQASLITGRFPFACGVTRDGERLPLDQPSIAKVLRDAGYQTGFAGEWRLNGGESAVPPEARHGFEYWSANAAGAESFLKQSRQKPFFLMASWGAQRRGAERRGPRRLQLRANVPASDAGPARSEYAAYYEACSAIDSQIGRLLDVLDEQRLADDTIVVFTAGFGDMLRSQGLEGGDAPYEEAVRAPLIVRYPGRIEAGSRRDSLASTVDLAPTLLALCGAGSAPQMQGRDLLGQPAESIYAAGALGLGDEWRMLVRGLDKLVVDRKLNITHLYNLGTDPFELDDLAPDPAQDLKRDELTALLKDWMRRSGDGMDPSGLKRRPPIKRAEPLEPHPR